MFIFRVCRKRCEKIESTYYLMKPKYELIIQRLSVNIWMFPKIVVPPNHPILIGISIINHPFWGTTIFGNIHMFIYSSGKSHALDDIYTTTRPRQELDLLS